MKKIKIHITVFACMTRKQRNEQNPLKYNDIILTHFYCSQDIKYNIKQTVVLISSRRFWLPTNIVSQTNNWI